MNWDDVTKFWDENLSWFFSVFCEINLEANYDLEKVSWFQYKDSTEIWSSFLLGRKRKVNKLLWHHRKLMDEIIVPNGHEHFFNLKLTLGSYTHPCQVINDLF